MFPIDYRVSFSIALLFTVDDGTDVQQWVRELWTWVLFFFYKTQST
jgi:hypothetical protein